MLEHKGCLIRIIHKTFQWWQAVCNVYLQYGMCLLTLIYGLPEDVRWVSHLAYGTLKKRFRREALYLVSNNNYPGPAANTEIIIFCISTNKPWFHYCPFHKVAASCFAWSKLFSIPIQAGSDEPCCPDWGERRVGLLPPAPSAPKGHF